MPGIGRRGMGSRTDLGVRGVVSSRRRGDDISGVLATPCRHQFATQLAIPLVRAGLGNSEPMTSPHGR
jgi:hypothetical protein